MNLDSFYYICEGNWKLKTLYANQRHDEPIYYLQITIRPKI